MRISVVQTRSSPTRGDRKVEDPSANAAPVTVSYEWQSVGGGWRHRQQFVGVS